jgi:hypothetical protein
METSTIIWVLVALVVVFLVYQESKGKSKSSKSSKDSGGVIRRLKPKKGNPNKADVPSKAELKKLTKNQLVELASKKNLKVKVSGKKAEVINEIHKQLK